MIRLSALTASLVLSTNVVAYDLERAIANLASDLATCASYLMIVSTSVQQNDEEVATNYMEQAAYFRSYAVEASNEKVTDARISVGVEEMLDEIDRDLGNVMVLFEQHQQLCTDISNDVEARLRYWLDFEG